MRIKRTDARGTIHDLANQLVNLMQLDEVKPKTALQKQKFRKIFERYDLFHKNTTNKRKREIIDNLKTMNFDEGEIIRQSQILSSIERFNRIVNRERRKIENEIRAGRNVKQNTEWLFSRQGKEIDIPRDIRNDLRLYQKAVKLLPFGNKFTKNKLKFYSGQSYDFIIKTGFGKPHVIPYDELQKVRREGNVVEYVLDLYKQDVENAYEKDKKLYARKEPKKWSQKKRVYAKIFNALEHNKSITTDRSYRKKLVKYNTDGSMKKEEGEYPISMRILDDVIDVSI